MPSALINSLMTGVLVYGVGIMPVLAFAALIFSGQLSSDLSAGLGYALVGSAILCAVIALFSSYPGSITIAQDASAVLLGVMVANVATTLPADVTPPQQFGTVIMMLTVAAVATGLLFLLLGIFKLAGLVRFLPFPVMGGFLAGTGSLLVTGGIGVMATTTNPFDLFQPPIAIRWLPGALLGLLMLVVTGRVNNSLVLPGLSGAAVLAFYAAAWLSGTPQGQLGADGWLLGPFPSGSLWSLSSSPAVLVGLVDWPVLLAQAPAIAPLALVSLIALLLNASGLELIVKRDIDLNRELVAAGAANVALAVTGGLVGYPAISLTTLNYTLSGRKRVPGLVTAILFGGTAFFGVGALSIIPRLVLGALLVYLGVGLLQQWVYRAWLTFSRIDFLMIVLIAGIVVVRGFLDGIAAGLALAVAVFVVSSSRTSVVKHALSGSDYRSRVTRDPRQQEILREHGNELYVLKLHGVIFFGTANTLYERLHQRVRRPDLPALRFVVLDFAQVTSMDSTGLLSFSKMRQLAEERRFTLVLTGLSGGVRAQFLRGGWGADSSVVPIFADLDHGLEWCENALIAAIPAAGPAQAHTLHERLRTIFGADTSAERLLAHLQRKQVAAGEHLIRQGEDPDSLFFIECGQVTAQVEAPGQAPVRLETMRSGVVGELGFYLGSKRTAAVIADEPTTVYCLFRRELDHLHEADPEAASVLHRMMAHLVAERVVHLARSVEALEH